jgi:valyl-tRNA synthetase
MNLKIFFINYIIMDINKDKQIELLQKENEQLKQQLSKYTNPNRNKKYQERNKEKILEYAKEYSKKYYEKKKLLKNEL